MVFEYSFVRFEFIVCDCLIGGREGELEKERKGDFITCHLLISPVNVTISFDEGKLKSVIIILIYIMCFTFFTHLLVCFCFYLFVFVLYHVLFIISIFLFEMINGLHYILLYLVFFIYILIKI